MKREDKLYAGGVAVLITVCLGLLNQNAKIRADRDALKATCAVQKAALEHPAVKTLPKVIYKTITKTVQASPAAPACQEIVTEYIREEGSESIPVVPAIPQAAEKPRRWAIGAQILRYEGDYTAGVAGTLDLGKAWRVEASVGYGYGSAGIMWRF